MLPGFRFLFAAIILSMSVLVFGLGAAALLRAAHEQFASIPSRRPPPEPVFAQHNEPPVPTLALLRFEPPAEKAPDVAAAVVSPETLAPVARTLDVTPAEPEKLAALKPEEPVPAEPVKAEIPATEIAPVAQTASVETPTVSDEVKLLGFDEPFIRSWNYYLKYCEAGFSSRNISVVQAVYTRPNNPTLHHHFEKGRS